MKYYLKIEDPDGYFSKEFSNVSQMQITGVYRKESVQQNLIGGYLIDRVGSEKLTIKTKINLMDTGEMYMLRKARDRISVLVTFDRGGVRRTKTMMVREFTEPTPYYYKEPGIDNTENVYYIYLTAEVILEEI